MQVRIAVLADYASVSVGDKLNILGIFSNLWARGEPVVHPQMHLVVQFEFDSAEAGKKEVRVVLQNEDGVDVLSLGGEINIARASHRQPTIVNQIVVLNNTTFAKFGNYEFRVLVNDRTEAIVPLQVLQVVESQPG